MITRALTSIVSVCLDILLAVCSYVVPKRSDLIVLTSHHGDRYAGNPRALFLHLAKNEPRYSPVWASTNKSLLKTLEKEGYLTSYTYSARHFFTVLRAQALIIDSAHKGILYNGSLAFLGRFNIVQLWHGTGFKNIELLNKTNRNSLITAIAKKNKQQFSFIIATSHEDQVRKQKSFSNPSVVVTGSPRNDVFYEQVHEEELKKNLGLERFERIILYAPTFRDTGDTQAFSPAFFRAANTILEENNSILVIKRHPHDKSILVPDSGTHIRDITEDVEDVQNLLTITDLLITDYSGITTDYVLTGRPVIFYTYDYDEYIEKSRTFYYDLKHTLPGPFVEDEDALLEHLRDMTWSTRAEYLKKYQSFKDRFHTYQDGKSSERVTRELERITKIKRRRQ